MMCKKFFLILFVLVFGLGVVAQGEIISRYSFTDGDTAAIDSIGGKDGTLEGTATISGNKLILDGAGAAWLPSDVLPADLESVTIEAWYTENEAGDIWSRLFDFGGTDASGGGGYAMFCVPHQYGTTRFTVATNGFATWQTGEDTVSGPIFTGVQTHVACVWDGPGAEIKIYLNGVLQQAGPTTMNLSAVLRENAYIGDSCYTSDAYMTGTVDEFRIYSTALTDAEVLDSFNAGADAEISAEPAESGPTIIFVTSVKDNNLDGIQDDISWYDWLTAEGYNVDFRPGNWIDPLDDAKIAELEAADLIIASRGMATGEYDGDETAKWNGLSTPIICTNAWMIRSNRWVWMNSTAANKDAGSPFLLALETTHPIFEGVALDADGLVEILDPAVGSGNTSFLNDILDVGNGTLIAQSLGIYNTTWIAEWAAGVEYYEGAGQIAGGPRMLLMAGTQDDPYTDENGNIMPVGVLNLNDEGRKLFLNAIEYLLPAEPVQPVHLYTFEDGTANDEIDSADGTLIGGAAVVDGAMVTTAQDQWMEMPGDVIDINSFDAVTIEAWYIPTAGANTSWSMLAYFGDNVNDMGNDGFFITSARGDDVSRAAISVGNDTAPYSVETGVNGPEYDDGLLHYMAATIDATDITLYIDGVLIGSAALSETNKISGLSNHLAYLAKGGYGGDPEWIGAIEQFAIYNVALTEDQVAANFAAGLIKAEPAGPSEEGLVAYYALDGDATDSSGNGLDGAEEIMGEGNAATYVAGVSGLAVDLLPAELGTIGPYVNCGADPMFDINDTITVSAWVNFRSIPDEWRGIVTKGDNTWRLSNMGATTAFQFSFAGYGVRTDNIYSADGTIEVGFDSWHHVCGTYDTTNGATLYVDGVVDKVTPDSVGIDQNTNDVWIGGNNGDTGWKPYRLFDGMIDEVKIYHRALSADEVAALAGM